MVLSLRVTISAVAALCVAVVAAITLSITLTSSLAALRDVGSGQAAALLESAQLSSEALFAAPLEAVETMQNLTKSDRKPWPANNATARSHWADTQNAMFYESKFKLAAIATYFRDNTLIISSSIHARNDGADFQDIPPYVGHYMRFGTPVNDTDPRASVATQTGLPAEERILFTNNHSEVAQDTALFDSIRLRVPFVPYTMPGVGPWDSQYMLLTGGGTRNVNAGVIAVVVSGRTLMYIAFASPVYRLGETPGVDEPYAFIFANLYFGSLDNFMRRVRATDGTLAVAVDNTGYLLASSDSAGRPTAVEDRVSRSAPGRVNCVTADDVESVTSDPTIARVCRVAAAEYGHDGLAAVMARPEFAFSVSRRVELVRTAGGASYFAGAARVSIPVPGPSVHVVLLIPEADVIGDVVRSRNVAIGVTCAVFVLVAAAAFAVITVLLAPLHTIAERMQRAADFDDDGADESVSAMSEVAALQLAYYEMNDELNRIRSFVPQSVLVAKMRVAFDDDDEDEDLISGVAGTTATATTPTPSSAQRSRAGTHRASSSNHDTRSNATHRTRMTTNSKGAGGLAATSGHIRELSLLPKNVAVLVANARRFSTAIGGAASGNSDGVAAARLVAALVDTVQGAVSANGGVLGGFHGDHFTATFNAVQPCSAPARKACAAAACITSANADAVRGSRANVSAVPAAHIKAGVAAGKCLVGNVGTAAAKTFSVVGPAFTHALLLERLTRMYGAGCDALVTERVMQDVSMHFRCRVVDRVVLPQRRDNQPMLVAALLGPVGANHDAAVNATGAQPPHAPRINAASEAGADNDEWLYVLEAKAKQDPSAGHNEAFMRVANGTFVAGGATGENDPDRHQPQPFLNPVTSLPITDELHHMIEMLNEASKSHHQPASPSSDQGAADRPPAIAVSSSFGRYYDALLSRTAAGHGGL